MSAHQYILCIYSGFKCKRQQASEEKWKIETIVLLKWFHQQSVLKPRDTKDQKQTRIIKTRQNKTERAQDNRQQTAPEIIVPLSSGKKEIETEETEKNHQDSFISLYFLFPCLLPSSPFLFYPPPPSSFLTTAFDPDLILPPLL